MSRRGRAGRSDENRRKKSPEPLGSALDGLTQRLGIKKKLKEFSVITSWASIVGEQIARVTTAERFDSGTLFVKTSNAPWRAELTMMRREIVAKINAAAGEKIVKEIRFR